MVWEKSIGNRKEGGRFWVDVVGDLPRVRLMIINIKKAW